MLNIADVNMLEACDTIDNIYVYIKLSLKNYSLLGKYSAKMRLGL